jgi:CDP-diacylglycerol--serine O-phosphatidyltransferase
MLGFYNYTVIATYMGLTAGITGLFFAMSGRPYFAVLCLMIAGLFDMFDGKIARTCTTRSLSAQRFGIQIDSLSDLICFGVLPAVIGISLGLGRPIFIPLIVAYILAALIRLAYFNVREEERQAQTDEVRKSYEGLPVTSVALIFPLTVCLSLILCDRWIPAVYAVAMALIAVAFISKFRVPKPGTKALIGFAAAGMAELVLLTLLLATGRCV